ncbi:MAG: M20/M25/M40 family metallo-hydrolase [Clostridia bacterium]|nr:M20/M25/M40 family metallo-hydrolase [Clostridia bacterium]
MNNRTIRRILKETDFIHTSGTPEELKVAEYLKAECEKLGVNAWLESFPVEMANVKSASLYADGREIPCEGFGLCGSGTVEAPLVYLPNTDEMSLTKAKGKIVLLDSGLGYFLYHDLLNAGAAGIVTYNGSVFYRDRDIDKKELRPHVRDGAEKLLCVNINAKDAAALVKSGAKTVKITVEQEEYPGESHNVAAELPGLTDEWIVLTAHYDTVPLSRGSYDNMSGCVGLLCIMDAMKDKKHRYGLRFVFCGSEERGLLGSKAYVRDHEKELEKIPLNINLDMIGTYMGRFIARVSAEDALVSYISYLGAELGFGIAPRQGVYSSDSTPFADKGVPALSFARIAGPGQAVIHNRYDTPDVLSDSRIREDSIFLTEFTRRMADSAKCPVKREIPEKVKNDLDEYLNRKRKKED